MSTSKKTEKMSLVFLLAGLVFLGLAAGKLVGYAMNNSSSRSVMEAHVGTKENTEENLKKYREQTKEVADGLKKKNLFYEPEKPPGPPSVCQAIFGDEAYIQYQGKFKWYKVGDKIGEHGKVTGIEATYVKVDWKGQEKKLAPIAVAEPPRPGPTATKPTVTKGPKIKSVGAAPKAKTVKPISEEEDEFAWMGIELTPEQREKLKRLWALMPDEMKEKAKQEWQNMTDEEKEKALEEFENMDIDMMEEQMQGMQR